MPLPLDEELLLAPGAGYGDGLAGADGVAEVAAAVLDGVARVDADAPPSVTVAIVVIITAAPLAVVVLACCGAEDEAADDGYG